ncbi:hypothetical protein ACIBH1_05340 [Nonomuraea sp. NPDC050663]|uniref:hypothetical protein n=1 Tax=Nonomuraea sp. NPDC050663 TaxID=3364370 RepID=UPI00378E2C22
MTKTVSQDASTEERIAALRKIGDRDKHLMLCYLAGRSPDAFADAYDLVMGCGE